MEASSPKVLGEDRGLEKSGRNLDFTSHNAPFFTELNRAVQRGPRICLRSPEGSSNLSP